MFAPTATDAGPVPAYTIDPHELTMKFLFCATPAHPHVQSNHAERRIEAQRGAYYVPKTVPLDSIMVEMLTIRHMLQHVPPFSPEAFVDMCHEYANAVAGTDHDAGIYPRSLKDAYSVFNGALNHMHKIAIRKLRAEVLAQPWAGKTAKDLSPYAPKKGEFWVHVDEEGDPLPEEEQEMRRNAARYEERVAREAASQSYEARLNASMEAKAARMAQACARADAEQARAEKARVETARRGAIERGVREARRASVRATAAERRVRPHTTLCRASARETAAERRAREQDERDERELAKLRAQEDAQAAARGLADAEAAAAAATAVAQARAEAELAKMQAAARAAELAERREEQIRRAEAPPPTAPSLPDFLRADYRRTGSTAMEVDSDSDEDLFTI